MLLFPLLYMQCPIGEKKKLQSEQNSVLGGNPHRLLPDTITQIHLILRMLASQMAIAEFGLHGFPQGSCPDNTLNTTVNATLHLC